MRKIVIIISILFFVFFDLGSKVVIEEYVFGSWKNICPYPDLNSAATVEYCQENTIIFSDFFSLHLSYNDGIAFSLPITGLPLQVLTILLLLGIVYFYIREEYPKQSRLLDAGYVFILAGAIAHTYERVFVGHVVDFIAVKYFAILNFADIFISLGAILLIFSYAYHRRYR